jgi:hypothetical protein
MNSLRCACGKVAHLFYGDTTIEQDRAVAERSGWSTAYKKDGDSYVVIDLCPTCTLRRSNP